MKTTHQEFDHLVCLNNDLHLDERDLSTSLSKFLYKELQEINKF